MSRHEQQKLGFHPASAAKRSNQDNIVSCDAPVAGIVHRLLAFAIDVGLVASAGGLVLSGFILWGRVELPGRQLILFGGAGFGVFWLLYQALWCLANLDSAGMCWARLRCLDFNGYRPRVRQRLIRLAVMCLGTVAAGLGLAWALVDEEGLTWQDHVSETFPTPY